MIRALQALQALQGPLERQAILVLQDLRVLQEPIARFLALQDQLDLLVRQDPLGQQDLLEVQAQVEL